MGVHSKNINLAKWRRLKNLNTHQDRDTRNAITMRSYFNRLIVYFDLNDQIKEFIKQETEYKNPKKLQDVLNAMFNCIIKNNFPITTSEFRKAVKKEFGIGREMMSDFYPKHARNYEWFINRVLSNVNVPSFLHQKIYRKVKENYDRLKGVIKGDPTVLISALCYLSYNAFDLGKTPDHSQFFFNGVTYRYYRKKLRELGIKIEDQKKTKASSEYHKKYYQNNKEKYANAQKKYHKNNKEKLQKRRKEYRENNLEKIKEKDKIYKENNKEKLKEYNRQYYLDNKEKIKKQHEEYRKNNQEKIKQYNKQYKKDHPEKSRMYSKKYYQKNKL